MSVELEGFRREAARYLPVIDGRPLPIGMGTAYLGGDVSPLGRARALQALRAAYTGGIRYFDTSAAYGESELRVGEFLREADRSQVFVATKGRIPQELTPSQAAAHIREQIENSRIRLNIDVIDLYQIHDVDTLSQTFPPGGALDALLEAKRTGLIRYIGLGTRWHDLLAAASQHGSFDTILTYLDYNLLDRSAAGLISLAADNGVGVINGTPLSLGLLTGQDPRLQSDLGGEQRQRLWTACRLYDFAAAAGVPLLALALQFPMRNPRISITLTGADNEHEVARNLAASACPIPEEVWRLLQEELQDKTVW